MKCPVCGSHINKFLWGKDIVGTLDSSDVAITNDEFGKTLPLYECLDCSFVYAYPLPENILSLYENLEDEEYMNSLNPRIKEMEHLLKKSRKYFPGATNLLDVGAGLGLLVKEAQKSGMTATGIEPSKWLAAQSKKIFNIDLITGTVPSKELDGKKFDMIFAVDVIEHLQDPLLFLNTLKGYLESSGVIIIATPDCKSFLASKLGRKWWHYRLAHIGFFSLESIAKAAEITGLEIKKTERQNWYLPFGYLLKRLSKYLPVGFLSGIVKKIPSLDNMPVRLNLHDSIVVYLTKE